METWIIGADLLQFDEETHTYYVNKKKVPSVTQILKFKFPRKYEGIDEEILKKAAQKGTAVHNAIEVYERYGFESENLQEFRDYKFLKKAFGFTVKFNEKPIVLRYNGLTIAGRLDLVLEEDGQVGLGDIKCTSVFDKDYLAYQLNLYKMGYEQSYNEKIEFLRGIHLKNGSRKYAMIPINEGSIYELLEEVIAATSNDTRGKIKPQ